MGDIDRDMQEFRAALAIGSIQRAYVALVSYMSRLRTRYASKRGDRAVSGLYQGYFDMTYFALFPDELRARDLKVAVVFDYGTFSFQSWLAARNRKVQKFWFEKLRDTGYAKHTLAEPGAGIDAIVISVLAYDFSLADESVLNRQIEAGVDSFENHLLAVLTELSGA